MRAVVMRNGELVLDEVPDPVPEEGELLVRVLACGICGSDLHALLRAGRIRDGEQEEDDSLLGTTGGDMVMGHEFCAEIIEFGPGTERTLELGARVVSVPSLLRPGGRAGIGYSTELPGGYGELIFTGLTRDDTGLILQGALPAAALAMIVQGLFDLAERVLVPRGLRLKRAVAI